MATLQNIGKLKYRGKDGQWHPLPVVVQDAGGGVSTISGKGAPTSETQGEVNQLYRDEDTQKLYICTATEGGYTWAEVSGGAGGSGGSVDVDATLTKAGQAADAKAAGDAIEKKIDKAQGVENAGKILGIGADGNVTPHDKPVQPLAGASAPTTATAGVVGQAYYVIVDNAVTEMYVCTAVANGTYTWDRVEFGAEESDPTVPAWAKEAQKPSYTASEVGADPSGTAASQVSAHNTGTDTHSDIRLLISGLTDRLNAFADSDDTTLDQLSEVVAYIKSNRTLIESITTSKVSVSDIIDNLTTNVTNKPLSAAQGVALKALIDGIVIPDKLPNPNALTFTGAVTGSYDGSAPLSVEIPSGGGSGGSADTSTIQETVLASGTVSSGTAKWHKTDTGLTASDLKNWKIWGFRSVGTTGSNGIVIGAAQIKFTGKKCQAILGWADSERKAIQIIDAVDNGGFEVIGTSFFRDGLTIGSAQKGWYAYFQTIGNETDAVYIYTHSELTDDLQWEIRGLIK